jgi:uncharacterized membrane protein YbhN (UPF0104 family)
MALARTLCWSALVGPMGLVRFRVLFRYTRAANAANVLLPARAGDAMRAWLLRSQHDIPLSSSGAAIAVEKILDLLVLTLLVTPLPWLVTSLSPAVAHALRVVQVVVVISLVLLTVASRHAGRSPWLSGLETLKRPSVMMRGFGAVLLCWLIDLGLVLLVLGAVGLAPRLEHALLVLLFVNVATAIPASPGQLGTHELASAAALRLQGAQPEQAVAFALLYHGAQLAPILVMGLADLVVTLPLYRRGAVTREPTPSG